MGNVQSLFAAGVNKYARNKLTYPLDNAAITLTFTSGAVGNIYTSSTALSFKPWERVEIYGNKGWLAVEDQYELILYDDELGPSKHWVPVIPNTLIFDEEFGGFMGMIENFLQVVRGYEKAVATGWDGYYAYELNIATHLSIANRTIIDLPLDSKDADEEVQDWLGKNENYTARNFLANAGLRNYLFIRLHTDTGITGVGEASLEWQEKTVETLIHEWVVDRIIGCDPFEIELVIGNMIRDQYQGGSTIMTAISGVEIALWDIIGKACNQPVYKLIGGRYHQHIPAYANGWYGGARDSDDYAALAKEGVARGYRALKFDPFGVAWKDMTHYEIDLAVEMVAKYVKL
jgi:hypothetical protein